MQEMAVSILLDEYTQLDVAQLLKEYDEAEENDELLDVPQSLDEKCTQMIQREFATQNRKRRWVNAFKVLTRVAMVTLILIGMCTVSVLSVKAWREPVLRFVLETFDRRSSIRIEGNASEGSKTPEEIVLQFARSVPKAYKKTQDETQDGYLQLKFEGQYGESIVLLVMAQQNGIYIDTENSAGNEMYINGCKVFFIHKNGYRLIWIDEDSECLFELSAINITEKIFWEIVYKTIQ